MTGENIPSTASELVAFVWRSLRPLLVERPGQILLSAAVLLMAWGHHGRLELLARVVPGWRGPGSDPATRPRLLPGVPWDHELISFWGGALLLVVVPVLLVKLVFREPLADYGLGLPPPGRRGIALGVFAVLFVLSLPAFLGFARDPAFQAIYPFYRDFGGWGSFALYELTYLPFFLVIEFVFRGYLLFGLARTSLGRAGTAFAGEGALPGFALLIPMLPYLVWHIDKPLPELWGALFWGLAAGLGAWLARSIWPVVFSHWLLNVLMDYLVLGEIGRSF